MTKPSVEAAIRSAVGVFATQVDFGYTGGPSYEIDTYGGKTLRFDGGRTELKLGGLYTSFPDNRTPGPTLDFFQAEAQAKHNNGPWTAIALVSYVPQASYGSGPLVRVEGEGDFAISKALTLRALLGRQSQGIGHERTYWSFGAATTWKAVTFDLRYVDTDRSRQTCGFQPMACDASIVGSITIALPPVILGRM